MNIAIRSWCVWLPQADGPFACQSFVDGRYSEDEYDKPALVNMTPMQKRRLGPLARVVFHTLDKCSSAPAQTPVVFSSVMGEIKRTQGILETLAADEAVSPAAFSLSVHNAIGGLWSLIRGCRAPMLALAPTGGSPVAALLEAAGILQEGVYQQVSVVFYDEDLPAFYKPYLQGPAAPYALALQVVPSALTVPANIELSIRQAEGAGAGQSNLNPLELLPLLRDQASSLRIAEAQCQWHMERCA